MGKNLENNLFLPSGCLIQEAIRLYTDGKLDGENQMKVHRHLEECPLCKEAVDGFKIMPDHEEQEEAIQDIRKGLFSLINKKGELSAGEMKIRRVYKYVAAAASVIIIAGMFSIYHFLLRQDNNMIADNIETEEVVPETIPDKQLQTDSEKEESVPEKKEEADEKIPDSPVKQPGRKKGGDTKKSEMVAFEKQEVVVEPEIPEEDIKLAVQEKVSRQVSAIQVNGMESEDTGKNIALADEPMVYDISGVEQPEKKGQKKSVVAGVVTQPEPAAIQKKESPEVYEVEEGTEILPKFKVEGYKDFDDYIRKNVRYPETAITSGINGNVKVEFFVNKKGKVIKVSVVEGIDEIINNEAIRVVSSSPRWIAAEINGEKITRKMTVTVEFYFK